jgi:hypothetical protein
MCIGQCDPCLEKVEGLWSVRSVYGGRGSVREHLVPRDSVGCTLHRLRWFRVTGPNMGVARSPLDLYWNPRSFYRWSEKNNCPCSGWDLNLGMSFDIDINFAYWYIRWYFLAYFRRMKVDLSNNQPVCVCATNNFWTDWWILIKFGRQVMPLKMTLTPHFLIS